MKVRISYSVEVSDYTRRQINAFYGTPGLASRDDIKQWFRTYGSSMNDDLSYGMEQNTDTPDLHQGEDQVP